MQDNTSAGAYGGIDLVLVKDGERIPVQCNNWRSSKVGVSTVRELFGVMTAEGQPGVFLSAQDTLLMMPLNLPGESLLCLLMVLL